MNTASIDQIGSYHMKIISTSQFLIWTFIPTYALGFLYYFQIQVNPAFTSSISALILLFCYMWIPALVTLLLNRHQLKQAMILYQVRFNPNRGWLGAWLYPLAIILLTILICLGFGWGTLDLQFNEYINSLGAQLSAEQLVQVKKQFTSMDSNTQIMLIIFQGLIAGTTINALAAFGEELGWRGLLLHNLRHLGFWKANLVIGFIWGLWHAPIIAAGYNFPQHNIGGIFMMIAATMVLSLLIGYVREQSGSVIAAAIFHGVFNALAGLPIVLIAGTSNIYRSSLGLAGIIGMLVLITVSYQLFGLGRSAQTKA